MRMYKQSKSKLFLKNCQDEEARDTKGLILNIIIINILIGSDPIQTRDMGYQVPDICFVISSKYIIGHKKL